jgi:hypothetical protein
MSAVLNIDADEHMLIGQVLLPVRSRRYLELRETPPGRADVGVENEITRDLRSALSLPQHRPCYRAPLDAAIWRQSAKRESLANSRGSTCGELPPVDGLASVANVELQHRNWSSMPAGGPRCPRSEPTANEPPTFRASLSPFVEITGSGEQQRVSVLRTWSGRRATLQHAERQHPPRTTASLRIGPRYITPLLAAGLRG